jgi:hypothetical protein
MGLDKTLEFADEKPIFQLFYLKNDRSQSVQIDEVEEIDCDEIRVHLAHGESVFITPKKKIRLDVPKLSRGLDISLIKREIVTTSLERDPTKPWYVNHV